MKAKLVNLLTVLVVVLTTLQGLIPTMPIQNHHTVTLISVIVMYLVTGFTAWKQLLSSEIDNNALKPTIIVFIISLVGGLNDIFNVIQFGETTDQWVRFTITAVLLILNVISKIMWPTAQTKTSI